ncbi:MAG: ceramidase domain-containing protein [Pseudomonadota bacterium]
MDPAQQIDAYCERVGPELWAEPLNALTNGAFLIAALIMVWRLRGSGLTLGYAMAAALALIGVTSGAWHIWALSWTGAADVLSILVFILLYLWASNRYFWELSPLWAGLGVLAFFPYAAAMGWVIARLPFFQISGLYWAVALLIGVTGWALRHRSPETARNLGIGATILTVSITARSLDEPLCSVLPIGTHFIWHVLNGIMLGWMIETYRRHRLRGQSAI